MPREADRLKQLSVCRDFPARGVCMEELGSLLCCSLQYIPHNCGPVCSLAAERALECHIRGSPIVVSRIITAMLIAM